MRFNKYLLFISIITSLFISACEKEKSSVKSELIITDDLGNSISIENAPQRVITLAPNLTEMIYSLHLQKYLVGNTLYCNYPEEAADVEKVGDMLTFNFEKIVTLKPDLIFITVEGNTKETYEKFKELGLKIFVSNPRNFSGIKKTYMDLAKIFGIESRAKNEISKWDSVTNSISLSSQKNKILTGAMLIEITPIMAAGKNTFFNEFLELCGIKNIADDSPFNYPIFSREELLKRDPNFIFYPTSLDDKLERVIKVYPEWKNLKAIKENKFYLIDRDIFSRPGPRFIDALQNLYTLIHQ